MCLTLLMPHDENSSAAAPAAHDSMRLSARRDEASHRRDAPSEARIAKSCARSADRVSMRLAAFTHAISTTRPTVPASSAIQLLTSET